MAPYINPFIIAAGSIEREAEIIENLPVNRRNRQSLDCLFL
jgi:hypothetical protein